MQRLKDNTFINASIKPFEKSVPSISFADIAPI